MKHYIKLEHITEESECMPLPVEATNTGSTPKLEHVTEESECISLPVEVKTTPKLERITEESERMPLPVEVINTGSTPKLGHVTEESERISLPVEAKTTPKCLVLKCRVRNPDCCSPFSKEPTSSTDSDLSGYCGKYSKKESDYEPYFEDSKEESVSDESEDKWKMNRYDHGSALALSHDGRICQSRVRKEWHGVRSTKGVHRSGKYFFETKVIQCGRFRLGWSTLDADLVFGTDKEGFGLSGTGKKANAKQFDKYGEVVFVPHNWYPYPALGC